MRKYEMILDEERYQVIKCKSIECLQQIEIQQDDFFSLTFSKGIFTVFLPARVKLPKSLDESRVWRRMTLNMDLNFESSGVLQDLLEPMASLHISVLAVSGYHTDYIFIEQKNLHRLLQHRSDKLEIKAKSEELSASEENIKLADLSAALYQEIKPTFQVKRPESVSSKNTGMGLGI